MPFSDTGLLYPGAAGKPPKLGKEQELLWPGGLKV